MKTPHDITPALLELIVMPNGEVLCLGKTVGWVKTLGRFLSPMCVICKSRIDEIQADMSRQRYDGAGPACKDCVTRELGVKRNREENP